MQHIRGNGIANVTRTNKRELPANKFHTRPGRARPHGCHGHRMPGVLLLLLLLLCLLFHFSVSVSSSVRCGIICKMSLLVWILRSSKPRRSNWRSRTKAGVGEDGLKLSMGRPGTSLAVDKSETHSERQARCDHTSVQMISSHLLALHPSMLRLCAPPDSYIIIKADAKLSLRHT